MYFGATVTLQSEEDGAVLRYQLVGPDETDLKAGRISIDSPVGRALLGRRRGEQVTVRRPRGEVELVIRAIEYR